MLRTYHHGMLEPTRTRGTWSAFVSRIYWTATVVHDLCDLIPRSPVCSRGKFLFIWSHLSSHDTPTFCHRIPVQLRPATPSSALRSSRSPATKNMYATTAMPVRARVLAPKTATFRSCRVATNALNQSSCRPLTRSLRAQVWIHKFWVTGWDWRRDDASKRLFTYSGLFNL